MPKTSSSAYKNTRAAAAVVIASVLRGKSLSALLPEYSLGIPEKERSLFKELCFGSLRWYPQIAILLKELLERPIKQKDMEVQGLLVLGIYQLLYMRISQHAVVNETVASAQSINRPWAKGLINGVLRRFQRERESLLENFSNNRVFQTGHPKWLLEKLDSAWSKASVEEIIIGNNTQAPMTLRVNQKQYSREKYLGLLNSAGIAAESSSLNESGIKLDSAVDVGNLPGFESGACSIQDEAAQLAAGLLELRPRQTVLDACCAPGGKTCHILEFEPDLQFLLAIDSETRRLRKVADNLSRLDLQAELLAAKAENPEDWWNGNHFDRILLDAPCSATGVIRRHPDIKILRKPTDIDKLIKIQLSLLEGLWKTLAKEGILVYATCSILPEENDEVIKAFIESQQDVAIMEIKECWGQKTEYGRQLFPTVSGHDGFYYARLKKLG